MTGPKSPMTADNKPARIFLIGRDHLFMHALEVLLADTDSLEHVGTATPDSDSCYGMLRASTLDLVALVESDEARADQLRHAVPHARFVLIGCFCEGTKSAAYAGDGVPLRHVVGCIPWDVARSELVTLLRLLAEGHAVLPKWQSQKSKPTAVLTPRQRDVLELVSEGRSNKGVAKMLGVSVCTVKAHMSAILCALQLPNRAAAAALWKAQGE